MSATWRRRKEVRRRSGPRTWGVNWSGYTKQCGHHHVGSLRQVCWHVDDCFTLYYILPDQTKTVVIISRNDILYVQLYKPHFLFMLKITPSPVYVLSIITCNTFLFLLFRYTTLVDHYVSNISSCLRDDAPLVRKQTLTLLTHLLQVKFSNLFKNQMCKTSRQVEWINNLGVEAWFTRNIFRTILKWVECIPSVLFWRSKRKSKHYKWNLWYSMVETSGL